MGEAKTDYNADNYNRNSLANIMQFITADLLIRHDIEGAEAFMEIQPQIVKIRKHIEKAHRLYSKHVRYQDVSLPNVAEGVLLWMRDGASIEDVLKASRKDLMVRGKAVIGD